MLDLFGPCLEDGRYPTMTHSIVVHPNGRIYTVPWIENPTGKLPDQGHAGPQVDFISFDNPLT